MSKKNVYFFDEWDSSRWNGIGTYRDIILPLLSDISASLTLVSLNSDLDTPKVISRKGYEEISVPLRWCANWRKNGAAIASILAEVITDNADNVFMLNHSPCAEFIAEMKKKFQLSRFTFAVHDMAWCSALLGDDSLLKQIMVDNKLPDIVSQRTAAVVKSACKKENDIFGLVDGVITLSPSSASVLESVYGVEKGKVFMIPNAFPAVTIKPDRKKVRTELGVHEDERIIVYVGRPSRYKGFDAVLRLAEALKGHPLKFRILLPVAFHSLSPKHKDMISKVAPMLILPGFLSKNDLYKWYTAADIGLLCSYVEQCSYAALEMMALTDAIVVSNGFGLRDMFENGKDAFSVDNRPVNDDSLFVSRMKDQIIRASTASKEELGRMARNRAKNLQKNFSPIKTKQLYDNLLNRL